LIDDARGLQASPIKGAHAPVADQGLAIDQVGRWMDPDPKDSFRLPGPVKKNRETKSFLFQKTPDGFRGFFGGDAVKN
jgi:hypothetical protein